MVILLLFILANISEGELYCPRYECEDISHLVPSGDCALIVESENYKTYYFKRTPCSNNYSCVEDPSNQKALFCKDASSPKRAILPGRKCGSANQVCWYGKKTCNETTKICEGFEENQDCRFHSDCNPGLRCSPDYKCVPQLKANASGCIDDYDCENSSGCFHASNSTHCVPYFSLPEGTVIGELNCGNSISGNLCEYSNCGGTNFSCLPPQTSKNDLLSTCTANSDCISNSSFNIHSYCECGLNDKGNAYCLPFFGDSPARKFFAIFKEWLFSQNNTDHCNTFDRRSFNCAKDWWSAEEYENMLYRYISYAKYPYTIDIKDCVRVNILPEYKGTAVINSE